MTLEGTDADDRFALSETLIPPAGAAPFRVTVPVEVPPPSTKAGLREMPVTAKGLTVSAAVAVFVDSVAPICATICLATRAVPIANVTEVEPAGIVALLGTVTAD